jgi:peptidoglycan/xylan/chitin deacetylase (PgdA/CDA1 family)
VKRFNPFWMLSAETPLSENHRRIPVSSAEITGGGAFLTALLFTLIDIRLAAVPLSLFLAICLIAPFLPRFSFFLPIISQGQSGLKAVALTYDDGPDPQTTPALLRLLQRYETPATFFVTGQKALRNPELIRNILAHGHTIGNHSYSHDNLIMLKSSETLMYEVKRAQEVLAAFGIRPLAFRPPVGITNPRLREVLDDLNMFTLNFSRRPVDFGNRRLKNLSSRILAHVQPDDIILLHDVTPPQTALFPCWLKETELILAGLKARGIAILPLEELTDRPVMLNITFSSRYSG